MDKFPLLLAGKTAGELTTEQEALYTWFTARCRLPREGIWGAWAVGECGELRLGILEPAGEHAVIRRRFSHRMTEPLGRVLRGEVRQVIGEGIGWEDMRQPEQFFHTPWLQQGLCGVQGTKVRQGGKRKSLAVPYDQSKPFPLVPLFCLARLGMLGGKQYMIFMFDETEWPIIP